MIELEFETAIFLYLLISIFGILFIWLLFSKIKVKRLKASESDSIWQCAICTYNYVDSKHKKLSVCPRCGSYNDREGGGH
jgi:hypothetical protein